MRIRIVTTHQLIQSQKKTELVCGFYGHDHPKCKRSLKKDEILYQKFMDQFKVDDKNTDDK